MDLPINRNTPLVMHVDLNSCFATCEQQANPHYRGKPLVIAAYDSPAGCVVAPSIEAKRYGIKTGMSVREAKLLYPQVNVHTPTPTLYRDVYTKFNKIFREYSPDVTPKSIDEVVVNLESVQRLRPDLIAIGKEIKQRIREEIGEWMSCNIGIGTNRFLAKLAASLHKPDGLDVITHENLLDVYKIVTLVDLNGINTRFEARLNAHGIFTPIDFLNAPVDLLEKQVFRSKCGRDWYYRIRGYEVDEVEFQTKSIGQQYALPKATTDKRMLSMLLMKLTEKMGRRLRSQGWTAHGVHVSCVYSDWSHWHRGRLQDMEMFTTTELYERVQLVFNQQPELKPVSKLSVTCYAFTPSGKSQPSLFDLDEGKKRKAALAIDNINDRYGEFVITPALMMGMNDLILDRVAFGGNVKELKDLYD